MRTTLLIVLLTLPSLAGPANWLKIGDAAFANQDWETAAEAFRELTKVNDNDGRSWFRLAYSLHAARELDEAIVAHKKAATFPKVKTIALYNLACAYGLKKNKDDALKSLEAAINAGFISKNPISKDTDLAILVGDPKFKELETRANVYRQFDFWVGNWDVFGRNGQKVGTNVVTLSQKGMLITENWTNNQGQTGTSMNFFDPALKKWNQIWVDPGGNVIRYVGGWINGAMAFSGVSVSQAGQQKQARMTFTPNADGTVRQFIQHSTDSGKTWTVYFDGTYKKVTR